MAKESFLERLDRGVIHAAGSIGSSVLARRPAEADFGGLDGCIAWLTVSNPALLADIQRGFYAAGCDAVDSATFGASAVELARHGVGDRTREVNRLAARQLNAVRDEFTTAAWPRYSFGSIGPGRLLPSFGQVDAETLREGYREQVRGLVEGGIDVLKVETCQDLRQVEAALDAIGEVLDGLCVQLPIIVSVTPGVDGRLRMGADMAEVATTLARYTFVDVAGVNCMGDPEGITAALRGLARDAQWPLFAAPNAGLPEVRGGEAVYPVDPEQFASLQRRLVGEFGVSIEGGCCGTTSAHFEAAIARVGRPAP